MSSTVAKSNTRCCSIPQHKLVIRIRACLESFAEGEAAGIDRGTKRMPFLNYRAQLTALFAQLAGLIRAPIYMVGNTRTYI